MDKEVKDRWVAALRSGEYEQGDAYLCNKGQYCCLGVLAEIEGLFDGVSRGEKYILDSNSASPLSSVLPHNINEKYGLFEKGLSEINEHLHAADILIDKNDSGVSFDEIADWIEHNL